jgi:hypothetical protein
VVAIGFTSLLKSYRFLTGFVAAENRAFSDRAKNEHFCNTSAVSHPALSLGLSFSFGGGSVDYGVGVRVFSNNEQDEFAASFGLDYMFQSQRWRPTVGAAYLGDNSYIGLDIGFDLNGEGIDFGVGVGGVNPDEPAGAIAPVVTPPVDTGLGEDRF